VDDLVLVDQDRARKGLGFVAVVCAVADGGELAFFGGGDFGRGRTGPVRSAECGVRIWGHLTLALSPGRRGWDIEEGLEGVAADQLGWSLA